MDYKSEIVAAAANPQRLEELYRSAHRLRQADAFREAVDACYAQAPDNVLFASWHFRLSPGVEQPSAWLAGLAWKWAVPLSVAAGLLMWALSSPSLMFSNRQPYLLALVAPLQALFVGLYCVGAGRPSLREGLRTLGPPLLGLAALTAVAFAFIVRGGNAQYHILAYIHLPLAAWSAVGLGLVPFSVAPGTRSGAWRSDHRQLFAFLYKSLEVFATGAIFGGAVGAFAFLTLGLFEALGMTLPEPVVRLLTVGGAGAVPVWAVAVAYDPRLEPLQQRAERGLGRLIPTVMYLLLPLSLVVGAAYLVAIPLNFWGAFRSRDVLVIYNALLFAVLALVVGATPLQERSLPERLRKWLRAGILILACMAVVVTVYALSATAYRTAQGGLTPNRLVVIGWNVVNAGVLAAMVARMARRGSSPALSPRGSSPALSPRGSSPALSPRGSSPASSARGARWVDAVQETIGQGAMVWLAWTVFVILVLPLLFR